jgi:hypothetical protein
MAVGWELWVELLLSGLNEIGRTHARPPLHESKSDAVVDGALMSLSPLPFPFSVPACCGGPLDEDRRLVCRRAPGANRLSLPPFERRHHPLDRRFPPPAVDMRTQSDQAVKGREYLPTGRYVRIPH